MQHLWTQPFSHQMNDVESALDQLLEDDLELHNEYLNWLARASRWHENTLGIVEDFFSLKDDQLHTMSRVTKKFLSK